MEKPAKNITLKKWIRRILYLFLGLAITLLLLRLSLKSRVVQSWVKDKAVATANSQLNGTLEIDDLSGDLWKQIRVSGVRLRMQQDTLAEIDSANASYNIWALLESRLELSTVQVHGPDINLRREGDRWNIQRLVKQSEDTVATESTFAYQVSSFEIENGRVNVDADSSASGLNFQAQNIALSSSFEYSPNSFLVDLRNLSLELENTAIADKIKIESAAGVRNKNITLEKLIVATGQSLIKSSAKVSVSDLSVNLNLDANPLSWKDIGALAADMPLQQDVEMGVRLQGSPEQFSLSVQLQADGLQKVEVGSHFQWRENLIINQLDVEMQGLDSEILFTDSTLPSVDSFSANFSGRIPLQNYRNSEGDVRISANNITKKPYSVDRITADGKLQNASANLQLAINKGGQRLSADVKAGNVWGDLPSLEGSFKGSDIDPEYWTQDSTFAGDISFRADISGKGWYPDKSSWRYAIDVQKSAFMKQTIENASVSGKASIENISADGEALINGGNFAFSGALNNLSDNPSYTYDLSTRDLDLSSFADLNNFESSMNSTIRGSGSGFSIEQMKMSSSISVDSSIVNGELIENFEADLSIRDAIAKIDQSSLQSTIATGSFSARLNLLDLYEPDNELSLDLEIRDVKALAPLVPVDSINVVGDMQGRLNPAENEALQFTGKFDFHDLMYGDIFSAKQATGSIDSHISNHVQYRAQLDIEAPVFSGIPIQDLMLESGGAVKGDTGTGSFRLQFSSPEEGRIEQAGEYYATTDSIRIQISEFNIISDYRTLALESPFDITYSDEKVSMETMRVSSGDGAFLEMEIPILSNQQQQVSIRGEALNIGVIQSCLIGKKYVDGLLGGHLEMQRFDTDLSVDGDIKFSNIVYQTTQFDSVFIDGSIIDNRMEGSLSVHRNGRRIANGNADVPFRLGDPETFPDSFFEEPVEGKLLVENFSMKELEPFLTEAGFSQTSGNLSFHGTLEGEAGSPKFSAGARVNNAMLSGVSVDSLVAGLLYNHEDERMDLNASILSLKQKAAEINATLPFKIDMKTFAFDLPEKGDSISVNVATSNFNLAAVNDFLDPLTMRNAGGRLDGTMKVHGPIGSLRTDGKLMLREGRVRFVPLGITIDHARTTLQFEPDKIVVSDFSVESGKGGMTADGMVALRDMMPGKMDIDMKARNFRIANTSQYNAVINMDTKAAGSIMQPRITGSVDFISGFLQLDNFGEKSVESVQIDSLEENGTSAAYYDSLAMNMQVSFDRRFYIRNQRYLEMEVELDGGLNLVKERAKDLKLFGTISAPSGYARPLGKEFKLQEGSVTFSGDPTNPQLMIRTRYMPPQTQQDIVIWYIIEGTVEKPKFKYESQPPMELENIISYTLFGQPFYALDSWKQVVAGSGNTSAANVALDVLLDRVEALATQKLGIDVVKIDNTQVGGETGTSITTGWYLNPRVFFAIQNVITGSTPDTSFLLEYMLREDLKLIIRQGNGIRQGVDIKWNYEY